MQTILVPLDSQLAAQHILPQVQCLAPALRANVLLLHVVAGPEREHIYAVSSASATSPDAGAWLRERQRHWIRARQQLAEQLETWVAPLRAAGISVECQVEIGPPAATIVAAAERAQVSLIALVSHGYSGLRRWAAGSVAEQIAEATSLPVLLVRINAAPLATRQLRRILVPLDGSVYARYALDHAVLLAHQAQAELIVLQTIAPSIEDYLTQTVTLLDRHALLRETVRRAYAARWGDACAERAGIVSVIGLGTPADAILEEALHCRPDLIVMAMPPHSALRQRSGGAKQVFLNAHIPLLLVHSSPPRD